MDHINTRYREEKRREDILNKIKILGLIVIFIVYHIIIN